MINSMSIIKRLRCLYPAYPVVVLSRNPRQAQRLAQSEGLAIIALPYLLTGLGPLVTCWLKTLRPVVVIGMETLEELRGGMARQARSRYGTRFLLFNFNGRAGDYADKRRLETDWEYTKLLPVVHWAGVLSAEAEAYLQNLGMAAQQMERFPNIKFDTARHAASNAKRDQVRTLLKIGLEEKVLLFGSVYSEEQDILLQIYKQVLDHPGLERTRLLFAPRYANHIERIMQSLEDHGLKGLKITDIQDASDPAPSVLVVDMVGELRTLYAIADVALVAGSMIPQLRGHNPIEPAAHGIAVITGPYTASFADVIATFVARDALIQLETADGAAEQIISLLEDASLRERLGRNARRVVEEEGGAEDRYVERVVALNL